MEVTRGQILRYTILPGFIPRIFTLATSGFSTLSFYMAIVYNIAKLLPNDHPYLIRQNIGKYGVRHVIAEAADNLVFKWKNIDQIIIFFTLLSAIALIAVQIVLFIMALMAGQAAFATAIDSPSSLGLGISINEMFADPAAGTQQDLAFIILDRVFGLQDVYNSCVSAGVACNNNAGAPIPGSATPSYPFPFHNALHIMLRYYSMGIVFVAAIMFIYFATTTVAETAATGTPFGQRFNRAWTPIRFLLFFAMILPLNVGGAATENIGLNGAQLITFWVAKKGSNFATNGWVFFNTEINRRLFDRYEPSDRQRIVAVPNAPELGSLIQFIFTAKTCALAETIVNDNPETSELDNEILPYLVRPNASAYGVTGANAIDFIATDYTAARAFSLNGDIKLRFGHIGEDVSGSGTIEEFSEYTGNVKPYCGEMTFSVVDLNEPAAQAISEFYYTYVQELWEHSIINLYAECVIREELEIGVNRDNACAFTLDTNMIRFFNATYESRINTELTNAINAQISGPDSLFNMPDELIEKGWAGAAIWYNRIATMNGAVVTAVANLPKPTKYPLAMELVQKERMQHDASTSGADRFSLILQDGTTIHLPEEREQRTYPAIFKAFNHFDVEGGTETIQTKQTGNAFIDTVNLVLGTHGLFEMRKNAEVHPLAQLSAVGRGMMEAAVRNTAIAGAGIVGGGLASLIDPFPKQVAGIGAEFAQSVIFATIGIALILYYVLPFLPFIYFLFAVSAWVKSIFEAIVAIPLWALAHIRIDGEGIPGQDAANGYFLILEIFLRPILILFGLLASISIFAALVDVLNNIFDIVVGNVTGFDFGAEVAGTLPTALDYARQPVDEFFFTAMYAVICYLLGISCFKLIDLIPNNILRWAGSNVATFQENAGDPAGTLTSQVYRGTGLVTSQVQQSTQGNLAFLTGGGAR